MRKTLSWEIVNAMRAADPSESIGSIAKRFGVLYSTALAIMDGYAWKDRAYVPIKRTKPRRKLTWEDVRTIRAECRDGVPQSYLAKRFGVSTVAVHFIIKGVHWRDPNDPAIPTYNGARPKLSPEQVQECRKHRAAGRSLEWIAVRYECHPRTVWKAVHDIERIAA